ncbi:MAG: DUF2203 domain-containing protein [Nitrospinota bacterium]|nr:DUF2203 domain-containing protein [Nitrospinota bacterium]
MSKKYFTVEEANAVIPELIDWVPRLQELYSIMNKSFPDVQKARSKAEYSGGSIHGSDYLRVALKANEITKNLENKGCVLKGVEMGLVDFPSIRDGREVYLCWKNPEREIRFWHDLNTGFAGRQPI